MTYKLTVATRYFYSLFIKNILKKIKVHTFLLIIKYIIIIKLRPHKFRARNYRGLISVQWNN